MDTSYKVQANEINYCEYIVQYYSSPEAVEEKKQEALGVLRNNKIKGFRKGKAPDHVIKSVFKKEIEDYVSVKLSAEAYKNAIYETKINPLGSPQFTKAHIENDKFFCEFNQLTKPKFDLAKYKNFEIPKPKPSFNVTEKVESALQELRIKHAELVPFEENDIAQKDDKLTLDIEAKDAMSFDDDPSLSKYSHQSLMYSIGQELYQGFDDEITGMKLGESRNFNLKLKLEKASDLPNQPEFITVNFKVTLTMGLKCNPHPLNDELAQNEGLTTLKELEEKLTLRANNLLHQSEKISIQQQIIQRLLKEHVFKIPEWMIDQEAQQLKYNDEKTGEKLLTDLSYRAKAENNLRLSFILEEIRKAEPESGLSDLELIESLKRQVQDKPELANWINLAQQNGQLASWLANARIEYVLEWIANTCKVVE